MIPVVVLWPYVNLLFGEEGGLNNSKHTSCSLLIGYHPRIVGTFIAHPPQANGKLPQTREEVKTFVMIPKTSPLHKLCFSKSQSHFMFQTASWPKFV